MRAEEILERGLKLLKSKGEDYTENRDVNQYQNFERSNLIASWFKYDEDKSFAVLIGTKLARLATLLNSNKGPNNESILDSFVDGSNYFALWGGKRASKPGPNQGTRMYSMLTKEVEDKIRQDQPSRNNQFNPNKPEEDNPESAQRTNPVCAFCKSSIDYNKLAYVIYRGKTAHIPCYQFTKGMPD